MTPIVKLNGFNYFQTGTPSDPRYVVAMRINGRMVRAADCAVTPVFEADESLPLEPGDSEYVRAMGWER